MPFGGYANRVAWIDLSSGSVDYRPIDESDACHYIGGRGLGVKYLFDNGPDVDPVGPDNLLCLMTGPLTGTETSMSGRIAVVTKSPLTGTCADRRPPQVGRARRARYPRPSRRPHLPASRERQRQPQRRLRRLGQGRPRDHCGDAGRPRRCRLRNEHRPRR